MSRLLLLVVLATGVAAACGPGATPAATAAPTSVELPGSAHLQPGLQPAPASSAAAKRKRFQCGSQSCGSDEQVCCVYGKKDATGAFMERHACVSRLATIPPPDAWGQDDVAMQAVVEEQVTACQPALGDPGAADVSVRYCASSSDCPRAQTCCLHMWTHRYTANLCTPARSDGRHACMHHEACSKDGAACASQGSRCSHGKCRLAERELACDDKVCRAPTPQCCVDVNAGTTRCAAVGDCSAEERRFVASLECASRRDCPPGMRCLLYTSVSACEGEGTWAHGSFLCETAADCPSESKHLQLLKIPAYRCVPHDMLPWLGVCVP